MTKKFILTIALAVVATLMIAALVLPPLPAPKKHGTRIQSVNSVRSVSFTLTNNIATERLPVATP